jgi:hypothetical protein
MTTLRSQDEIRNTVVSLGLPEHPYFMRRTVRAMDLLDTGKVNFVGDDIFRVQSQFDDQIYHVELNHGTPGCTCPDHQKNPGVLCKHMIAATIYSKQSQAITIVKTTDGEDGDYWRRCWLIAQGNRRTLVYEEYNGRLFCNCGAYYQDCKHKQLVIKAVTKELEAKRIAYEFGSTEVQALQKQLNSQLPKSEITRNESPSQLDLSDPFQECESYDIDQIEGRKNGELYWQLENGKYCLSYAGVMKLADKHNISFSVSLHDDTNTVIAKAMNGNSRVSGKPMNGCTDTAIELAKRNAARQLLPLVEIKAVEKKAQLEAEFDWQKAHAKCVQLVGIEANVDIIIHELTQAGKLRPDTPSHKRPEVRALSAYNRTEWLIIHNACKEDADEQPPTPFGKGDSCEELRRMKQTRRLRGTKQSNHGDPSERTPEIPNNADDFVSKCKSRFSGSRQAGEAIAKAKDEDVGLSPTRKPKASVSAANITTKSIEANDQPLKKEISCREICEQFESKRNPSIVTRLRTGIDDGADISTVELDD